MCDGCVGAARARFDDCGVMVLTHEWCGPCIFSMASFLQSQLPARGPKSESLLRHRDELPDRFSFVDLRLILVT
jgi:hypothetical protein